MKKTNIIGVLLSVLISLFALGCVATVILHFNPDLNKFKLKRVEKNALKYIRQTYPEFIVDNISVEHDWKSSHYIVEYSDKSGESRTISFDHTGKELFTDNYIDEKADEIIWAYESGIEQKIDTALKNRLGLNPHYIIIDGIGVHDKEREIALEGLDISDTPVVCSIGIIGAKDRTTLEFAQISKDIYITITSLQLPVKQIKIHQQLSPDNRYDIVCPESMEEMSIEEINKLVNK